MVGRRIKNGKFSEESTVRTRPGAASFCSSLLVLFALLPSCDIAELRCLETDGACNSALVAALFQPTKVIAIAGSGGQIWVSRDGGANYLEVIPGDPAVGYLTVHVVDSNSIFAAGNNGAPYYVDSVALDSGWLAPFIPPSIGSFTDTAISPDGEYAGFTPDVSTLPTFYYKRSSSENYSASTISATGQSLIFHYAGAFHAVFPAGTFIYRRQTDGSFNPVGSTAPVPDVRGVAVNENTAVLIDNPNNRVLLSTDGGLTWNPHAITGGTGCSHAAFGMGMYAIFCGGTPSIVVSTDGQNWSATGVDPTTALPSIQSLSFADGYFYITGQNSSGNAAVMRTTDFFTYEPSFEGPAGIAEARDELTTFQSLIR